MRILAIETATPVASVALLDAGGVLASRALRAPMRHLEWIAAAIDGMLRDVEAGPESVEAVAVGRGPGGFTGLRIGIATATAWARARGVPVLGVGTLETLACAATAAGLVLPVLDAHRGEVAAALFRLDAANERLDGAAQQTVSPTPAPVPRCLVPPVVATPEDIIAEMRPVLQAEGASPGPLVLSGDGLVRYAAPLARALAAAGRYRIIEYADVYPRAETAGALARPRLLRGLHDDPAGLLPVYGRRLAVRPWQETPTRPGSEG